MVIQNTIKNTPEYDLDTFCIIISQLTSKYRPDLFETSKIADPDKPGLWRTLLIFSYKCSLFWELYNFIFKDNIILYNV